MEKTSGTSSSSMIKLRCIDEGCQNIDTSEDPLNPEEWVCSLCHSVALPISDSRLEKAEILFKIEEAIALYNKK